jgi:hypothetical protein
MAVPDLSSPATHPVPAVPATQTPAPKQIYLRVTPPTANSEEALFLRQFGGKVVQTTRHRLDLSLFRRFAIGDWMADRVEGGRQSIPPGVAEFGRSLRSHVRKLRS